MNQRFGQWISYPSKESQFYAVLELDQYETGSSGWLYFFPSDGSVLSAYVQVTVPAEETEMLLFEEPIHYFNPNDDRHFRPDEIKGALDIDVPQTASFSLRFEKTGVVVDFSQVANIEAAVFLRFSAVRNRSKINAEKNVSSWAEFKKYALPGKRNDLVYRGQERPYPLQTSFHRTTKSDLHHYRVEILPELNRMLSDTLTHHYDLSRGDLLGSFLHLAQHHGFPTPLLDWTRSPFVAAYFAFKDVKDEPRLKRKVRIYCLDLGDLKKNAPNFQKLILNAPHLSQTAALNLENPRAIPQQSVTTLTNIRDLEGFLRYVERTNHTKLLTCFDLPANEADQALQELRLMGITEASMFPGIEGTCAEMKKRIFEQ